MEMRQNFWKPNIDQRGRRLRFVAGLVLCLAGIGLGIEWIGWVGLIVAFGGAFLMYEGLRGWCFARACGIKTRI
ncbi:MAG: DUF2892 domain-containing protein [Verrucomicrobiae bacterium]|nr:DUF2892 domain-containing protein [Verrucomicrobiae bacterium]